MYSPDLAVTLEKLLYVSKSLWNRNGKVILRTPPVASIVSRTKWDDVYRMCQKYTYWLKRYGLQTLGSHNSVSIQVWKQWTYSRKSSKAKSLIVKAIYNDHLKYSCLGFFKSLTWSRRYRQLFIYIFFVYLHNTPRGEVSFSRFTDEKNEAQRS